MQPSFTPTEAEFRMVDKLIRREVLRPLGLDLRALNTLFFVGSVCGLLGAGGVLMPLLAARTVHWSSFAVSAVGASVAFLLLLAWAYARQAVVRRLASGLRKDKLVASTVEISDRKLVIDSRDTTTAYGWSAIRRIEVVDDCAVFLMAVDSAPFVPARAFGDQASFERFVQSARAWHAQRAA